MLDDTDSSGGHELPIIGLVFSDNARILYSIDTGGFLREWDIDRGLSNMNQVKVEFVDVPNKIIGMCLFQSDVLLPLRNAVYNLQKDEVLIGHAKPVVGITPGIDEFVSAAADRYLAIWRKPADTQIEVDESDWSD
jgi:hypothetical protein